MLRTSRKAKQEAPRKVHLRKNDQVVVLSGKDRGKRGKVLRIDPAKGTAIVERVNFVKKHTRKNPQKNQQGGIVEREGALAVSKLMVICPSCSEPSRLGRRISGEESTRICKNCDAELS